MFVSNNDLKAATVNFFQLEELTVECNIQLLEDLSIDDSIRFLLRLCKTMV